MIADALVPEYITRRQVDRALEALARIPPSDDPEVVARLGVLHGAVAAMTGEEPDAHLSQALALLPELSEPTAAVVLQRAGVACFYARRATEAEGHLLQSLWLCDANGMRWLAARTANVLYGVHYHLTGDFQAARYYAEVEGVEAVAAGDPEMRRLSLYQQYDLAVLFGEWSRAESIRNLVRRESAPDAFGYALTLRTSDCLLHAHSGDFAAMRGTVELLLKEARETPDIALARAFMALALAGLGLDEEAHGEARRALGLSRDPAGVAEFAHLTIRRRIAAVLASYASILVGDVVHGTRALEVRGKWSGAIGTLARSLVDNAVRGAHVGVDDPNLRSIKGCAIASLAARDARLSRLRRELATVRTLTDTELVLLRSAASGKTNAEIARERGVTRNAVERRLMSAYEKLGVKTRAEAIAKLDSAQS